MYNDEILKNLLKDDVINLKKLLKKRGKFIGLDSTLSNFLSKIFDLKKDINNLSVTDLSKAMNVDEKTVEAIVKPLISNDLILIKYINKKMIFNFESLIDKLIKTYSKDHEKLKISFKEIELKTKEKKKKQKKIKSVINQNWLE